MRLPVYYAVKVKGTDERTEVFRYDTEEEARAGADYQFVDNWRSTKSAVYLGKRVDWLWLFRS